MKFGLILKGPVDKLKARAGKLNPGAPLIVVDENTFSDKDLSAVFVFKPFRDTADHFNQLREKEGLQPFFVIDVPLQSVSSKDVRSSIRSRLIEILKEGPAYGYLIYKKYRTRHGNISLRLVYYHLNKGEKDGLFEVVDVEQASGDFSWGDSTKRKYYKLKFPV